MKKLKKLKSDKRGMTLIELLIVLVIFALMAAFSIPTMLGFVNETKGKAYIAEARTCYIAAQVIATEESAFGTSDADIIKKIVQTDTRFASLVGSEVLIEGTTVSASVTGGKVTEIVFVKDSKTITIEPGKAAVVS